MRITGQSIKVLAALRRASSDLSGSELSIITQLPSGTIYPMLARLKDAGWLAERMETTPSPLHGPPRKFYRLTVAGRRRVEAAFSELQKAMEGTK